MILPTEVKKNKKKSIAFFYFRPTKYKYTKDAWKSNLQCTKAIAII